MRVDNEIFLAFLQKEVGEEGNITQTDLAEASGVNQSTISGYIKGRTSTPRAEHKRKILEALQKCFQYTYNDIVRIASEYLTKRAVEESKDDTIKMHYSGDSIDNDEYSSPHHLDPAIQLVNEMARKKGKKLTPDQARAYADGIREKYFSDDPENVINITKLHRETVEKFKNKQLALEINEKLVELESLSSIELARLAIEITDRIETLKQKNRANGTNPG